MHELSNQSCMLYLSLHLAFLEELKKGQKKFLGLFYGLGCDFGELSQAIHKPVSICRQQAIKMYRIESDYIVRNSPTDKQAMAVVKWKNHDIGTEEFSRIAGTDLDTAIAWFSSIVHCKKQCEAKACICYRHCARGRE